jgi:hypothetical protein
VGKHHACRTDRIVPVSPSSVARPSIVFRRERRLGHRWSSLPTLHATKPVLHGGIAPLPPPDIFDEFLDALGQKVKALKLGDPLDEASDIGTVINEKQFRKVCGYVEEGLNRREARVVIGGLPPKEGPLSEGYYTIPTIFANVANDWRLAREEIFGPVLVAIPWTDEADAIRMANDTHYGLAAYVWSHDIGRALRAAHAIEAGWVQVNQGLGQTPGHSTAVTRKRHRSEFSSKECSRATRKERTSRSICRGKKLDWSPRNNQVSALAKLIMARASCQNQGASCKTRPATMPHVQSTTE